MPPLHLSANFAFKSFGEKGRYDYTRSGNPTRDVLAETLAQLEGGSQAVITASGLAAIHLITLLLREGERMAAPRDGYGGTWRLFEQLRARRGIATDWVDWNNPAERAAALALRPRLVWIESPSNPLLRLTDIRLVVAEAHAVGALVVVDNTFLSPALQNPISLGADLVVHSTTKLINGHSDVVGGAVVAAAAELGAELAYLANAFGLTGAPFDSWLTLRGLRTLAARVGWQQESAGRIAKLAATHGAVQAVHYPGLATSPEHALATRQQRGAGTLVTLDLRGGATAVRNFTAALRHFTLAESLGGVESLVAHPVTMTHASMSAEARERAGISPSLVRLSCGLENPDDLLEDVGAALDACWNLQELPQSPCTSAVGG
jgi:cystathionine gamma-synthase